MWNSDSADSLLRSLPIWKDLDDLMIEARLLNKEAQDFDANLRSVHHKIDALTPFNATTGKEISVNDSPIAIENDSVYFSLPYCASYVQSKTYHRVLRVDITEEPGYKAPPKPSAPLSNRTNGSNPASDDATIQEMQKPLTANEVVYVCQKYNKAWVKAVVTQIYTKQKHTNIRVRTQPTADDNKPHILDLHKYRLARMIDLTKYPVYPIKRVIAGYGPHTMMPGIVGESPSSFNFDRYLVFTDNGKVSYYKPDQVYPILGQSTTPWRDALTDDAASLNQQLRFFFSRWPQRQFYSAKLGANVSVKIGDVLHVGRCIEIDCSLMRLEFPEINYEENIYRGSPRIYTNSSAHNDAYTTSKLLAGEKSTSKFNARLQTYIKLYHYVSTIALNEGRFDSLMLDIAKCERRKSRNIAVKSTSKLSSSKPTLGSIHVQLTSEENMIYESEDKELLEMDSEQASHRCAPDCLKYSKELNCDFDVKYRDESCLKIPHFLGWRRIVTRAAPARHRDQQRDVIVYKAPCGRLFRGLGEITRYIKWTGSKLDIDYFCVDPKVKLTARDSNQMWVRYYNPDIAVQRDKNTNQIIKFLENKPISLVNSVSEERLPEDFEYRAIRFPHPELAAQGFTFNEEFRSCCDCTDNCSDRFHCACQRLTEEGTERGIYGTQLRHQYNHKRLNYMIQTGLFECNADCPCNYQCPNRVVQKGMQFRLQVFRTLRKGWGVRTLDDIPKGAFVCTYSAELLDDADNYGDSDMYYADLDYITVNEQIKLGDESEDDPIEEDYDDDSSYDGDNGDHSDSPAHRSTNRFTNGNHKQNNTKTTNGRTAAQEQGKSDASNKTPNKRRAPSSDSSSISSLESNFDSRVGNELSSQAELFSQSTAHETHDLSSDEDFSQALANDLVPKLKPRDSNNSKNERGKQSKSSNGSRSTNDERTNKSNTKKGVAASIKNNSNEGESVSRYPKRSHAHMATKTTTSGSRVSNNQRKAQFKRIHDILDSKNYTLDARMQGNVGRFFNHSHDPNLFAQNVFIDTHDLRFPWVAFFASENIRAMDEIVWNYNYIVDSIQGREMECHCGAQICTGRIL